MDRVKIWDIPVRLFHWLLAGTFIGAFAIANVADDESAVFTIHMLLGGVAAFIVLLRLVWGAIGSRWARFGSFAASPRELVGYLAGVFTGRDKRYAGHNPGSSVAAYLMFALILGLALTGVMMGNGGGEAYEEVHEILAWAMVMVVGAHVAGIAWHTLRHREFIARSMVDGRKQADAAAAIPSTRPVAGLVFLTLTGLWTAGLVNGYDAATRSVTLPLLGRTLHVGEGDDHEGERHHHDDDDDDDD